MWSLCDVIITQELEGHNKKVGCLQWHPTAENVLASGSADGFVFIWNIVSGEIMFRIEPQEMINSIVWNYNGSRMAVSCKKNMYVYDVRKNVQISVSVLVGLYTLLEFWVYLFCYCLNTLMQEGPGHSGSKPTKLTYCGRTNLLFSTGFSRSSEREYALWNPVSTCFLSQNTQYLVSALHRRMILASH